MMLETISENLLKRIGEIQPFIGNTPLYPLTKIFFKPGVQLFAKLEWQQLSGSVKARAAFNIIREAILSGELTEGKHLLDATSGNTGIAYATIAGAIGIPVTLCVPENASPERKLILKALGVNVIYTSRFDSTDGSQLKAQELLEQNPEKYFYADQYKNDNNWKAHYIHTSNEIYKQTDGKITHFVAGLGTTGTFTGTGRGLKKHKEDIKLISLQPQTALHGLEGWKHLETAIVPKIYDDTLADSNLSIDTQEAYDLIKKVASKEGLLLSPSSAANLLGAIKTAQGIEKGVVVTVFPDNAEKYSEVINSIFNNL
jgi:S-sulfo-L-cysteine synthase (O-acetyl-L-serine-dependent)